MSDAKFLDMLLAFRLDLAGIVKVPANVLPCSITWDQFRDRFIRNRADALRFSYRTERRLYRERLAHFQEVSAR